MKKEPPVYRNEEICDIINRMPTRLGKWVAIAVVILPYYCLHSDGPSNTRM